MSLRLLRLGCRPLVALNLLVLLAGWTVILNGLLLLVSERVPLSDFEPARRIVYGDRPCEVLPNALWKTLREIRESFRPVLEMAIDPGSGYVVRLTATDDRRLIVHWH